MCESLNLFLTYLQVAFYEIMAGLWVRNGLQIKGQAMTYIQCHFCKSMVDADLFLLQLCATHLPTAQFINNVVDRFGVRGWLSMSHLRGSSPPLARSFRDPEQVNILLISPCKVLQLGTKDLRK